MDMKKLLEAVNKFSGEPEQTPGDQVRGDEKAKPSKDGKHPFQGKLVGEMAKIEHNQQQKQISLEQRLEKMYQEFKDTIDKRPARQGSRHPRGHEPQEQYQVLQDESSESEKRVATKLKNIERLKTPISDEEWEKHQKLMKKEREEWIKDNPNSIFKEDEVLAIKEDPFGQWVIWDKVKNKTRKAFDDKESAYGYLEHVLSNDKNYAVMHGSEVIELAEYGTMQNIKPGDTATNNAETDKETAQNIATATTTIKQATGAVVPPATLAKAIDSASQGNAVSATDARALEPVMGIVKKAASDPKIAQQFKNLAQQANR